MYKFLIQYKKIKISQYEFSKKKSTVDALAKVLDMICHGIEINDTDIVTFIDISKAFDNAEYANINNKLEYVGFELIKNYPRETSQMGIRNEEKIIHQKTVKINLPQGSL